MENNVGIMCYMSLLEMETEHQKINEMIMAPKFAKLLTESVDKDDFIVHRNKTIEMVSEFVNKSFKNTNDLVNTINEHFETITPNNRLIAACESKLKSLTRDDMECFNLEKYNIINSVCESKNMILADIKRVNEELTKILETQFESKEDYSSIMNSFKDTISDCTSALDRVDVSAMDKTDVSIKDLTSVLSTYKSTSSIIDNSIDSLNNLNRNEIETSKDLVKIKEAVYLGTEYLMRAANVVDTLVKVSHENAECILSEFVVCEASENATIQFESVMSNMMNQAKDNDYDDFI